VGPGVTLAGERLLPVVPALRSLLPGQGLRRGTTVAVSRSAALALALVAGASAAGSWVAAVGLPDLGIVAAAETGVALERLALVPAPGDRAWPAVVAALLDAVDVVLVRSPARLPAAQARRLAARARERGAVLVPLGAWSEPADLRLAVTASAWHGLGQGHGRLQARRVEVLVAGRGAAARERRALLWLPSPDGTIVPAALPDPAQVGPGGPTGPTLAGEGDAPARAGRQPGSPFGGAGARLEGAGSSLGGAGARLEGAGSPLGGAGDRPAGEGWSPGPALADAG
jgi:hypothetical protein